MLVFRKLLRTHLMSDPLQKQESLIESVMIVNSNHAPISPMSTNFQT